MKILSKYSHEGVWNLFLKVQRELYWKIDEKDWDKISSNRFDSLSNLSSYYNIPLTKEGENEIRLQKFKEENKSQTELKEIYQELLTFKINGK